MVDHDFGLKGLKLKNRILEELHNLRAFQPSVDAVDTIRTEEGGLLCIVREDGLSLVNSLEGIKSYLGGRIPIIAGIDSADISLMNIDWKDRLAEVGIVIGDKRFWSQGYGRDAMVLMLRSLGIPTQVAARPPVAIPDLLS